jgi:transcriptional regulator with XRE-family HTH domain
MKTELRYGKRIKQYREARGWTQEHLAAVAGVEARTIQRVERNQTKSPETLLAIAAAFDVALDSLRSTWRIAESRLTRTQLVTTYKDFIAAEEQNHWHAFSRCMVVPLKEDFRGEVEDLCDRVFADRDVISPDDHELWRCHTDCIQGPLEALFDLGFAFYILDECRDLFLQPTVGMTLIKDYIDDWRVRYFALVPSHACFQLTQTEPLHRFDQNCDAAGQAFFRTQRHANTGAYVYKNALFAMRQVGDESSVNWCDTCFPKLPTGLRITFEYIEHVTGLNWTQLQALSEASIEEPFLYGLA